MARTPETRTQTQENFTNFGPHTDQVSNESLLTVNGLSIFTEWGISYIRDESTGLILTDGFHTCDILSDPKDSKVISRVVSYVEKQQRDLIPPSDFFDVLKNNVNQENLIRKKLLIGKIFPKCEGIFSNFFQNYLRQVDSHPVLSRQKSFSPEQLRLALAFIFDCDPEQISLYESETMIKDNIKFHYGDFHLIDLKQKQPEKMGGSIYFDGKTFDDLTLPDIVGGDVDFRYLEVFRSLTLPRRVGNSVYLHKAKKFEKLNFPEQVNNVVLLSSLTAEEIYKLEKPSDVEIDMR